MAIITEVKFAHEQGALAHALTSMPELDVIVVREASTTPKRSIYLLRLSGDSDADVRSVIRADPSVKRVEPLPGFDDQNLCKVEFTDDAKLINPEVTVRDGFVLDARSMRTADEPRGWHERWLLPDTEALHEVWEYAREEGFDFEIVEFRQQGLTDSEYPGADVPTEEQHETLIAAFEQGYFAEPRETSLEELADSLDLSPTAVSGRLRRGMKSLIGMTIIVDEPDDES